MICLECTTIGACGQNGCRRAFPGLHLAAPPEADVSRWLYSCPWCGGPVLMALLHAPGGPTAFHRVDLFDVEPWSPADDVPPDGLKPAALRSWKDRRRRQLGLARLDFRTGSFLPALAWPPDDVHAALFKIHRCQEMVG